MTNKQPLFPDPPGSPAPKSQKHGTQDFVEQMMYMLAAPTVTWPGYEEDFRDRKTEITLERMAHAKEIHEMRQCTEFEAMLYVSTATLAAPPSAAWTHIYFWLFRRWSKDKAKEIGLEERELDWNEKVMLAKLRRWIFDLQMKHLRQKLKEPGRPGQSPTSEQDHYQVIQARLI